MSYIDTLPPLVSLSKLICTHDQFLLPPWLQALPMRLYEYELQELSDIEQTTNNIQPDKSDLLDYADVELITKVADALNKCCILYNDVCS